MEIKSVEVFEVSPLIFEKLKSWLSFVNYLKVGLSLYKKLVYLLQSNPVKRGEKYFLLQLKRFFRSQDI